MSVAPGKAIAGQSVKFGGPFTGFVSSVLKHLLDPDKINSASVDVQLNPFDGSWVRRRGSTIVGDTVNGSNVEQTGLLEQLMGSKCRRLGQLDSPSFSDGLPVPSALLTVETNAPAFPAADTGFFGTMYVRDVQGSHNYSWLSDFSSTHYPTAGGAGSLSHLVIPLWYESGEGGYTRGATKFTRRFLAPGSRSWLDAGDWRYFPNLRGTPCRWNKRLNVLAAAGAEYVRVTPTGPFGPMFAPTIGAPTASTGSDVTWLDGDTFYFAVMFQYADGSYSLPTIPRTKNGFLTNGLGFKTVGTPGGGAKYRSIPWTNIAIGGDDVIARVLLRSPKQTIATTADTLTISFGNLQICGILRNNTQTSYTDTLGDDLGLLDDPNIVRFDWTCPKRARAIGSGDSRAIIGYTLPSPCAIRVAPSGNASSRDLNFPDTGNIVGATNYLVRVTSVGVELLKIAVGGTPSTGGGGNQVTFDYATYGTLQTLVDAINATTTASLCGEWCADLAPGVDGTMNSGSLTQSVISLTGCSASGATLTTASDTTVPLGYEVYDSNGKIAAGTYVSQRSGATSLTLSAAATGAVNATQVFYANTGDNCLAAGFYGYMRAFCPTVPVMLCLKRSAQVGYAIPDKRSIFFTVSSPGAAQVGVSLAAQAWASPNRRQPEGVSGNLLAITGIEDAAMLEYSRSRHIFLNRRGVTSGEDFDYRTMIVNLRRGAIDSRSCVAVNNVAVCVTRQGIVAADKSMREAVISNAIHHPGQYGLSSILSEINQCLAGSQGDSDTGVFVLAQMGTQLHAGYRSNGSGASPNRRHVYDFSKGAEASGLAGILDPQSGQEYGWSAPFTKGYSAMSEVTRDAGVVRYGWSDTNAGATGDGRLDVIDDPTSNGLDNGVAYLASIRSSQLVPPPAKAFNPRRSRFVYSASSAGTLLAYGNRAHSSVASLALPVTSGDYGRVLLEYPLTFRGNSQCYETIIELDGDVDVLWEHELEYDLSDTYSES